ncbi:predicted protein [Aspergillus terreus NIH2624]|uniref:Uncharacterized protein n=1 Tax=Aspergillus terreus (strain NIH 2624 / FGSC A1156) TaxID=341663 RepID=Q0CC44_ASPTN|nr:uncharacterized protein ATEG_08740 [Aspergillus terreus NIH2624]EAU30872.1 predicted protein [Aspergillus terreus NIH2624]
MDPTSFSPFTGWLTVFYLVRWSTGALGADAVPTSVQNDPHFMGWYNAPTTTCDDDVITYDNGKTADCANSHVRYAYHMVCQDRSYLTFAYRSNIHYIDVFGKLIYSNFTNHKNQPINQLLPCTSCIPGEPSAGFCIAEDEHNERTPPNYLATNREFIERREAYDHAQEMDTANTSPVYELGSYDHR